jgi:hypothetical protein
MEEKVECRHQFLLKKNLSLMEGIEERLLWAPATIAWKKGLNVVLNFLLKKNLSSTLSTKQNRSIEEQ